MRQVFIALLFIAATGNLPVAALDSLALDREIARVVESVKKLS